MKNATEATPGSCKDDCEDSGFWYIALFSLFVFIHSTSEVGSMLLILRCVHPQDKAMALGLIQFAIGLFGKFSRLRVFAFTRFSRPAGNVPCPILYGAVVDSACLIWEMTCGKQGACYLYNSDSFRIFYHGNIRRLRPLSKPPRIRFASDFRVPSHPYSYRYDM